MRIRTPGHPHKRPCWQRFQGDFASSDYTEPILALVFDLHYQQKIGPVPRGRLFIAVATQPLACAAPEKQRKEFMATLLVQDESLSAFGIARSTVEGEPLSGDELRRMDAYWRATLYLSLGMIYLKDNPLLREPLTDEHVKMRLLGHWGSDPGMSLAYIHLNRLIKKYDLDMIFLAGPGHGAPALLANAYLEGTYSEIYPNKSQDLEGLRHFFKAFSFPGGIGSHCTPETPGSIHEGGELGYSVSHAYGAAFDNPDLIVAVMVGDGEAETGPLAAAWHSNKFLNPARDGAVLPILHLNGYKINNPTILARISRAELEALFRGYGYTPYFVEGSDHATMHQALAATLEHCVQEIQAIQAEARQSGTPVRPRWPLVVLRSPKGWTGPKEIDGHKVEGSWRSHQVPMADVHAKPAHMKLLVEWLKSYRPAELFDESGRLMPELRDLPPTGTRRMSATRTPTGAYCERLSSYPIFGTTPSPPSIQVPPRRSRHGCWGNICAISCVATP